MCAVVCGTVFIWEMCAYGAGVHMDKCADLI